MDWEKINNEYINLIEKNPYEYYEDYKKTLEAVRNSTAIYKGEPVPFLYHPMFYTPEDVEEFEYIGKIIMSIANKVAKRYMDFPEYRTKFEYSKLLEDLILVDEGYHINVPIGRFDIFYGGKDNFKFCEFNTDGSSAMNEDNTLARILMDTKAINNMKKKYNISYFELIYKWVEESTKIFKKFNPDIEKPNVAIVDFKESGTPYEFEEFKKAYINKGFKAVVADPRELKYIDGKLYFKDIKIDLIYRRIVTKEFVDRIDEIEDLVNAYKDGSVCMIGSLKSQIMHNKIIFKVLHEKETLQFLTEEERNFIKKHIPYTEEFNGEDIYKEVLKNKDKYILKPKDLYASKGVYAGKSFSSEDWKRIADESLGKEYICQEFCEPFTREFVNFEDGKLKVSKLKTITGIFMYNEKFEGLYTRLGKSTIISGLHDYYTVPNIVAEEK
jgi:glutathionylspermidine synthase